jgi:hypothetical protein
MVIKYIVHSVHLYVVSYFVQATIVAYVATAVIYTHKIFITLTSESMFYIPGRITGTKITLKLVPEKETFLKKIFFLVNL